MSGLTYLITGAARGIGKGLLTALVARPNTTIIAAVRDPSSAEKSLSSVQVGKDSKIIIVKLDATVDSDPAAAVSTLKTKHNITHVDILISNSGTFEGMGPVAATDLAGLRKNLEINAIAPVALISAFLPLLLAAKSPKFLVLTSSIGTISGMESYPVPFFSYGVSKAAANYMVRKVAFENPTLVSMALNPGWVQSDMGTGAAKAVGMEEAPLSMEESVKGMLTLIDGASLEKTGTFINVDGAVVPW